MPCARVTFRARVYLFVLLAVLAGRTPALAWGNDGHRIICQIAFERLTPAGKALVAAIQADLSQVEDPFDNCPSCQAAHPDDGRPMSFQEGCTWADESRRDTFKGTYEYHYINVSNAFTTLDLVRDCAALDCAVAAIQRYARYIALPPGSGSREKERRVLALRFLGHFVGDVHQPLHVGFAEDLGGNQIGVRWNTGTATVNKDLHSVWDGEILKRAGLTSQTEDGPVLNAEITSAELTAWQTFDVKAWAAESFALAQSKAYKKPDGTKVMANDLLSDPYFNAAAPVVRERLKQAGVRLAHLINAAAAGTLPVNILQIAP
jgi:nuclease S1